MKAITGRILRGAGMLAMTLACLAMTGCDSKSTGEASTTLTDEQIENLPLGVN
jgi:hypothetical protein